MKGIKYIGPVFDYSGYGEASRNYVLALHKAGIPVTVHPHCFDRNPPPVGSEQDRDILNSLVNKRVDYDIVIVHLTPDLAPDYVKSHPGKYVISYTVWETSKLHPYWAEACNKVREVWVPSEWNVKAFKESGVNIPIHKIPHGIDINMYRGLDPSQFEAYNAGDKTFNFYSVFQWNFRKNPEGLLRAYFNAFQGNDGVRLILKAYVGGGLPQEEDARRIKEMIAGIKQDMRLPHFPKLSLINATLSSEQLRSLHMFGDAYVSLPFGEGWGLGYMEAGLAGKPVIGTGAGGNMEFMTEENSFLVKNHETFVSGMGGFNPWYLGNQRWYQPDLIHASEVMQQVYNNIEDAKKKGALLKQSIADSFSWDKVATRMINRLKEI